MNKRFLLPKFLQKIDNKLLLSKPEVWSARTHLVIWYSMLFAAALSVVCFFEPNDLRASTNSVYWVTLVSIIAFLALIIWLIYLLRFNVFKRFGNITGIGRLTTFVLYFINIGCFVFLPFVHPIIETVKANIGYTDKEIVNDVNEINVKIAFLEYDSIPHKWIADTVYVLPKINSDDKEEDDLIVAKKLVSNYRAIDTAQLHRRIEARDSFNIINDSVYIFYECYDYQFFKPYQYKESFDNKIFSKEEIFDLVIRKYKTPNIISLKKDIETLYKKYYLASNNENYYYADVSYSTDKYDTNNTHRITIPEKYKLYQIRNSMDNILQKKHRFDIDELPFYFRLFFYFTFGFTLLTFIFRHSTPKTFFLSLLSVIILVILSSLFIAYFRTYRDGEVISFLYIFYTLIAAILATLSLSNKRRNAVHGIGINIFTLAITFVPIISLAWYYENLERNYTGILYDQYLLSTAYKVKGDLFLLAEIVEVVLLLILIPTFIHKLYRKWYALPEQ